MKQLDSIPGKIMSVADLTRKTALWRMNGKKIALTNGVFDILHVGHLASISQAASEGDYLIVAVNSDASVKKLKGDGRPVNDQDSRALMLAHLLPVDAVIIFDEDTPLELIKKIMPDVLVKGGDYTPEQIAGAKEVIAGGGRIVINPIIEGISTTGIINRVQKK